MKPARILIVDDDAAIRIVVTEALRREHYEVKSVANLNELSAQLISFAPDLLITDVMLPDGDGLDYLPEILAKRPDMPVIILSAQNTLSTAVRATEQGAFDYLPKPFDLEELCRAVAQGLLRAGDSEDAASGPEIDTSLPLIGRSGVMQEVYRLIARVMSNDLNVLILGESGTGKELVARAIHDLGPRKSHPFIAVNMAAIPRELIEAELFGHERGAFTGAATRNAGRFEQAAAGTLFLDEIGDMPMEAQTRLLRVLQSGEFTTVGGSKVIKANVRVIAATHKNLATMITDGSFREDLYYRLNVVPIEIPPLRQRGEDVGLLAQHFLERAVLDGLPRKRLNIAAQARLAQHGWPGNVRELENLMRRMAALVRDDMITSTILDTQLGQLEGTRVMQAPTASLTEAIEQHLAAHFATYGHSLPPDGLYDVMLAAFERPLLKMSMAAVRNNQLRAAKLLGMNRNTLRKKLVELEIEPHRLNDRLYRD